MLKISPACKVLEKVDSILDLLKSPRFGLKEIKDEVRDIEEAVSNLTPVKGPLTTGPLALTGPASIQVSVQNTGRGCVDAVVRVFDVGCCPPKQVDRAVLRNIGRCCAEQAVVTAPSGIFEVAVCPKPDRAAIRAFVTVQPLVNGTVTDSPLRYRTCDLLPLVCPFCKKEKDRCEPYDAESVESCEN